MRGDSIQAAGRVAAVLIAGLALGAGAAQAQSAAGDLPTGRTLSFSVGLGMRASDNPDFKRNPGSSEASASASLGLQLRSVTDVSSLTFTANTLLLQGISGDDTGFERPQQGATLSYSREGRNTSLSVNASLRESRIDYLRPLSDFIDDEGELVLPDDLDDLSGTGWRRHTGASASLTLGREAPFGVVLGAGYSDISYRDASNPSLEDSERWNASARMRFDLTPVTRLNLGLGYSSFKDDDGRRETWSLSPGLSFDRPDGSYSTNLGVTRTEDGTRLSAELGRTIERPWGSVSGRIGAVRLAGGDTVMSGGGRLTYAMRHAQLGVGLERSAVSGSDDEEVLRTALSVNYQRALSDHSSLGASLSYVTSDNRLTGSTVDNVSFGLSYSHALSKDWSANIGYNYRTRDESGVPGSVRENVISVSLSRSLVFGF